MDFSKALLALKAGRRVARSGWNGKDMWLILIEADDWEITRTGVPSLAVARAGVASLVTLSWIGMRTAQGDFVPWLASQTDILAEDWVTL